MVVLDLLVCICMCTCGFGGKLKECAPFLCLFVRDLHCLEELVVF